MHLQHRVKTFTDKFPLVGPVMWMLSIEYFIVQVFVARAWDGAYSISTNTISDLGNTSCGVYDSRYVCSPLHSLMNAALISLGVFMIAGSMLIYQEFRETKLAYVGFGCLLIGGIGGLLVGLFPENTVTAMHWLGAFLTFFVGNIGVLVLGFALILPRPLRIYTLLSGIVTLVALGFFVSGHYLGLGEGGMERIVAYPQTAWLIAFGLYMSKNHYSKTRLINRHRTN